MKPANWILIASLYVTQFLPVSFFFMGLPAILRAQGKTLEEIGALYLLGFVWVFKILWAPMIDRLSFGRLGHYRGWLIVMQTAMIGMLLLISSVSHPLAKTGSFSGKSFDGIHLCCVFRHSCN